MSDLETLRPELVRLLGQFHVPPSTPWALLRTPTPIKGGTAPVSLEITYSFQDKLGATTIHLPTSSLDQGWRHHRIELLGMLLYLKLQSAVPWTPGFIFPDDAPRFKLRHPQTGELQLDVALLCQRAYVPDRRGEPPALLAELHWWPGQATVQDYYRVSQAAGPRSATEDLTKILATAERARRLLHQLAPTFGGRRRGEDPNPDPTFPARYAEVYWRLFDLNQREPAQIEIADDMGVSTDTISRRRTTYKTPLIPPRPGKNAK